MNMTEVDEEMNDRADQRTAAMSEEDKKNKVIQMIDKIWDEFDANGDGVL
jgi:hypothetical protein